MPTDAWKRFQQEYKKMANNKLIDDVKFAALRKQYELEARQEVAPKPVKKVDKMPVAHQADAFRVALNALRDQLELQKQLELQQQFELLRQRHEQNQLAYTPLFMYPVIDAAVAARADGQPTQIPNDSTRIISTYFSLSSRPVCKVCGQPVLAELLQGPLRPGEVLLIPQEKGHLRLHQADDSSAHYAEYE